VRVPSRYSASFFRYWKHLAPSSELEQIPDPVKGAEIDGKSVGGVSVSATGGGLKEAHVVN
jgi:hypothetical protein